MITRVATQKDIQKILSLQEVNLFENLSETEKLNGFITIPFTVSQVNELIQKKGVFVGEDNGNIWGYTMADSWEYFSQWPIFPYMISRITKTSFKGIDISEQNSFQYGPVCIKSELRGTSAFQNLFERMRMEMSALYPVGITFINKINKRSYNAHTRKLGMVVIDEFKFSGREYYGLAFDTNESVL